MTLPGLESLTASEVVALATERGGVVTRIAVVAGDLVKAGQPLFSIDSLPLSPRCHGYRDKAFCLLCQVTRWQALSARPAENAPAKITAKTITPMISGFSMIGVPLQSAQVVGRWERRNQHSSSKIRWNLKLPKEVR